MHRCIRSYARNTRLPGRALAASLLVVWSLAAGSALAAAQEQDEEPANETATTGPKITIHGFLSQAYAKSDGFQYLGISKDGTSDYRTAALQIRADINPKDVFVVQLSHERLGQSPLQELRADLKVDWLFYEHRFGNSTIKVGRIQIPFGIYNEVLDVGTLLPFYRPSTNFYGEAAYSTETVDGVVLSHNFELGGGWDLDADLHFGTWGFVQRDALGVYGTDNATNSIGAELWLDTPVPGLRAGAGAMQWDQETPTGDAKWRSYHVSLAGEFDRFSAHAEFKDVDVVFGDALIGWFHLGFNVTDKVTVNAQQDLFYFKPVGAPKAKADDDFALGVNYAFNPSLVLKAEHHWDKGGFWLEPSPPFGAPLVDTRYWIVSLSTAF